MSVAVYHVVGREVNVAAVDRMVDAVVGMMKACRWHWSY
jgi:hypothetical protein